jgi:hypothetical protein
MIPPRTLRYQGQLYVLADAVEKDAITSQPIERAMIRINDLISRGQDPVAGTKRRLEATFDRDKIMGIEQAALITAKQAKSPALKKAWEDVAAAARKKYKA